jgi:rod shape-determining protein MreC
MHAALSAAAYPVQWMVNSPFRVADWIQDAFADRDRLRRENTQMTLELRDAHVRLQRLEAMQEENRRLRELREASSAFAERNLIAEILRVDLNPARHLVLLNKGSNDGVFRGQAVIDAQGVFGQITQVGPYSSQALLITDPEHAIPVRVNRNGLRTIAEGTGNLNKLNLPFLTGEADIKTGDLLVSSGLGGIFPAGYPVGRVTRVERNPADTFATVEAQPLAKLDRDHEVMLVWFQENSAEILEAPLKPADAPQPSAPAAAPPQAASPKPPAAAPNNGAASTAAPAASPPPAPAAAPQAPTPTP